MNFWTHAVKLDGLKDKIATHFSLNVILRREPKNLEGVSIKVYKILRGACPELAEGLRMTTGRLRRFSDSLSRGILLRLRLPEDHRKVFTSQAKLNYTTSTADGFSNYYVSSFSVA